MGLISRVSSRTYRKPPQLIFILPPCRPKEEPPKSEACDESKPLKNHDPPTLPTTKKSKQPSKNSPAPTSQASTRSTCSKKTVMLSTSKTQKSPLPQLRTPLLFLVTTKLKKSLKFQVFCNSWAWKVYKVCNSGLRVKDWARSHRKRSRV